MLQVKNIFGGYGGGTVIHDLSFNVNSGVVFGVCGRNGVGKTTLIRLISGELNLNKGDIRLISKSNNESSLRKLAIFQRHSLGLSVMPQEQGVFSTLTVQENLMLGDNIDTDRLTMLLEYFQILKQRMNAKAEVLSGGEKKILCFVRTLSEKSLIVCLDEPSEGVAQENINIMTEIILAYKKKGTSFIICEQNIDFLIKVIDEIMILDKGESQLIATKDNVSYEQILQHIHV